MIPRKEIKPLFKEILKYRYNSRNAEGIKRLQKLKSNHKLNLKFIDDKIDEQTYHTLNNDFKSRISELSKEIEILENRKGNLSEVAMKGLDYLQEIDVSFKKAKPRDKKKILSSILEKNLVFENGEYRIPKYKAVARLIFNINNDLEKLENKKGADSMNLSLLYRKRDLNPHDLAITGF